VVLEMDFLFRPL